MVLCSYYIYAVRGLWMDRFKIGYFIGDLNLLKRRYSTYYGTQLELYIFEIICDKQTIINIEKKNIQRFINILLWYR